ncbi:MAG: N-acetylneuraminate synthase [Chromatiales bacterium]|jgi:N-acetylneuraminate synthase
MNQHVFIIAEAGVNHNGDIGRALEMIEVAAAAGVDAIKFQTFVPELLASATAPQADYQSRNNPGHSNQLAMLQGLSLDFDAHHQLQQHCKQHGIAFMSSPFDLQSADFLIEQMQLERLKLGSGEITNAPLLLRIAQSHKPVILSTGMSTLQDTENALAVLAYGYQHAGEPQNLQQCLQYYQTSDEARSVLNKQVALLHCTTEYPCPFEDVNLNAMDSLAQHFGLPVGYSDHTDGIAISIAAVAKGACIIEKHFTLDRALPGPDHQASIEPEQLRELVTSIRQVSAALGLAEKQPAASEQKNIAVARKSLTALSTIMRGEPFSPNNLGCKRPGSGLSPMLYWDLLGQTAKRDYQADEMIGEMTES